MAEFEDRNPWLWGVGALVAGFLLPTVMGNWGFASPVVVFMATFVWLWWLRERDDKRRSQRPPGSGIVR